MTGGWQFTVASMPPVGHVVEVWHLTRCTLATWDGQHWRDDAGRVLDWIVNWREYRA